jgi:outer membrane protein
MKNISIILNAVLIVAVGVLFYLHFSSSKPEAKTKKTKKVETAESAVIAYVNIDSLTKNYKFFQDLRELLLQKQQNSEQSLNRKAAAYEKEAMDFQEKIEKHLITQRQAEEMQQKLMSKQQTILKLRETLGMQLAQDEAAMNKQLHDSINSFLNNYNSDGRFKMILSISMGQNLLYGDESLDITEEVIEGLNERYSGSELTEKEEIKKDDE